jgi:cyclic dehypoxanthinyl futalosine synthase
MDSRTATDLYALGSRDLLELGMSANQMRLSLHPQRVVTYELRGRASSLEEAFNDTILHGGTSVDLEQNRDLQHYSFEALKDALSQQRDRFPGVTFQHLPISKLKSSPGNVCAAEEILTGLHAAGVRSVSLEFEPASSSASEERLSSVFRAAANSGLCLAVSVTIGNSESFEQRIDALKLLRDLQHDSDATQVVLVRVHRSTAVDARREEEATAIDYLKTLAVTRLLLDNVPHIQTDWSVMGPKVLELALRFGADDAGAIPWAQSGTPEPSHHGGESELRRIIRDAGFRPVERDALFRQSLLR